MVGDVRIARSIEFQMTRAAERKEREPKLVLDGVGTRKRCTIENRIAIVKMDETMSNKRCSVLVYTVSDV